MATPPTTRAVFSSSWSTLRPWGLAELDGSIHARGVDAGRVGRHKNKAIEQLQAAQAEWLCRRAKRLDWINEELRRQGHTVRTFRDADEAIRQYNLVVGSGSRIALEPKPKLSDFYQPSPEQRDREIAFVIMGLGATSFAAYYMLK